jgi:hypothetical protein
MRPTADTPPTRAAAADTDGPTDTPSPPDVTEYDREHVQLVRTQRTETLRLQAIAPDGEGGHTLLAAPARPRRYSGTGPRTCARILRNRAESAGKCGHAGPQRRLAFCLETGHIRPWRTRG